MVTIQQEKPKAAQSAASVTSAALPSGVTLPYVEQGDPAGVPVVLLHGVTVLVARAD